MYLLDPYLIAEQVKITRKGAMAKYLRGIIILTARKSSLLI